MPGLLLTERLAAECESEIRTIAERSGMPLTVVPFPVESPEPLPAEVLAGLEAAFASPDLYYASGGGAWSFIDAMEASPNLRWAHLGWAGVDNPRLRALAERGVLLSNSPGAAAEPIAHTLMAGLLALARRFPYYAENQRAHRWERLPFADLPRDLSDETLVIFGLGAIGGGVAAIAQSFGLRVIGVRRSPRRDDDHVDELVHPDELERVLGAADWLAITAPLTDATLGLFDARRLALLPPGARLLNVARGKLVDEAALIAALRSGALGGAYLDVVADEPLAPESPLWDLPNVIVTPHASWAARGNADRARQIFLRNLEAWVAGQPLPEEIRY